MSKQKVGNQTEPENPTIDEGVNASLAEKINSVKSEEELNKLSEELMSGDLKMEEKDDIEKEQINEEAEEDKEAQQFSEQEEEPQTENRKEETTDENVEENQQEEAIEDNTIQEINIPFHGEEKKVVIDENGINIPTKFLGEITEDNYNWNELIDELQLAKKQRRDRKIIDRRRKTVRKIEKNEITDRDLDLLSELKNGNKEVLESFIKEYDIDPYDLDIEKAKSLDDFKFKDDDNSNVSYEVQDVMDRAVQQDGKKHFDDNIGKIKNIRQYLPDNVFQKTGKDPTHFAILYNQVREGNMNKILPRLIRQLDNPKVSSEVKQNPDMFWEYYRQIGEQMGIIEQPSTNQVENRGRTTTSKPFNEKKKQAGAEMKGKKSSSSNKKKDIYDYTPEEIQNMSEKEFKELEKNI